MRVFFGYILIELLNLFEWKLVLVNRLRTDVEVEVFTRIDIQINIMSEMITEIIG